jgi:20S proteasome alpha/beta subunit
MTLDDGMKLCLNVLKQVMEEKISSTNIEVGICRKDQEKPGKFHLLGKENIDSLLTSL